MFVCMFLDRKKKTDAIELIWGPIVIFHVVLLWYPEVEMTRTWRTWN